jgi:glutamyl-tRNA reductase
VKQQQAVVTCVGINHQTSPVEEREQLAFSSDGTREALAVLGRALSGAVLLSTCNRTEVYASLPAGTRQTERVVALLNAIKGTRVDSTRFYAYQHLDAVRHLFRVSAGIDSMVLGESQILGQVRDAMSHATEAGTLNGVLSKLFHAAVGAGKRARTETHIGRHAVSVGSAAVTLARKNIGDLADKTVLVISAGSMGKLAARALSETGGARVVVANRTRERAQELAAEIGPTAEVTALEDMQSALAGADIIVSGTAAEGFIIGPDSVRPVMAGRNGRGLLFIDIAVPRDIDPAVREIDGVHLLDIDDIEAVTASGLNGRQREVERVAAIIEEEVTGFIDWWRSLDVVPVIAALRERAEEIRRREVERALGRLPDLDAESRERIEAMTAAIVKKMLNRPIARLKDGADKSLYMQALEDLFDLHRATGQRPAVRGG